MTTEAAHPKPQRARLSRRALRGWAWVMGGLAFFTSWAVIGRDPKPLDASAAPRAARPLIIRRIVVIHTKAPAQPTVRYVSAPAAPAVASTGGS